MKLFFSNALTMRDILKRAGLKESGDKSMADELCREIRDNYGQALKSLPESVPTFGVITVIKTHENSKNSFKEAWRVIQRNLLRCHPLIHRPAVHLRSKLSAVQLNISFK